MHQRFLEESLTNHCNSEYLDSSQSYLQMMYGQNDADFGVNNVEANLTQEENPQPHTFEAKEPTPPPKRAKVMKQKGKAKKKSGSASDRSVGDGDQPNDEDEGNKQGPNWKDHWIVNLIHLRGTMHDKFSGMKK